MKKERTPKTRNRLFLITGCIWAANALLQLWWMIDKWEVYGGQRVMEMRGLIFVLSLLCAILNFANVYLRKTKE